MEKNIIQITNCLNKVLVKNYRPDNIFNANYSLFAFSIIGATLWSNPESLWLTQTVLLKTERVFWSNSVSSPHSLCRAPSQWCFPSSSSRHRLNSINPASQPVCHTHHRNKTIKSRISLGYVQIKCVCVYNMEITTLHSHGPGEWTCRAGLAVECCREEWSFTTGVHS